MDSTRIQSTGPKSEGPIAKNSPLQYPELGTHTRSLRNLVVLTAIAFTQACAIPAAEKPKKYVGTDTVGTFTADQIVGNWRMTPLQYSPTAEDPIVVVRINADGTAVARSTPPEGTEINFAFESTGTWQIVGDQLSTEMTSMKEVSGNQAAALVGSLMKGLVRKDQLSGTANPYVLTTTRMVLVNEEGHGVQYDRI